MRPAIALALALTLVTVCAGCTPGAPTASADMLESSESRQTDVDVPQDDADALMRGNRGFAFDLYRTLAGGADNLFFSPHSISLALAMTYAGARGETKTAMADALGFDLPSDRLHSAFNHLDMELSSRGERAKGKDGEGFRLNIVNAIWGQRDYPFLDEYLDTLALNYGAGLRVVDFQAAPEESRVVINDWVEEQTEDRIQDLIPQGAISTLTRLVLTNAVYFNAAWASQFEEAATREGMFHPLDASDVTVPMMHQSAYFPCAEYDGYTAIQLPYDGSDLAMLILVPDADRFKNFEEGLNADLFNEAIAGLEGQQVVLSMPRFKVETSFNLNDALSELGMGIAFDSSAADFSGMDGRRDLYISDVVHKGFVDVDEAGTEAAAATAVIVGATSAPAQPIQLTIDRPFVFLIRDVPTRAILFVGRVVNPA